MEGRKDLAANRIMIWGHAVEVTLDIFSVADQPMVSAHWNEDLVHINITYHIFPSHHYHSGIHTTPCLPALAHAVIEFEVFRAETVSLSALSGTRTIPHFCALDD
jgi:hypothetical protein